MMGAGSWKCFLGLIFCLLLLNCKHEPRLSSKNFPDKNERIEILQKQVKFFSEVENAEFDLFNVNGFEESFFSTPGASNWDLKFVVKVKPEDVSKWTEGFVTYSPDSSELKTTWTANLIDSINDEEWPLSKFSPIYYKREPDDGVQLMVFPEVGIIYKRIYQN